MPQSRKSQVSLADTPYYHCVSRCVRKAFLCGEDKSTGKSYEHRRGWVEEKLHLLSQAFAIEVCAYAVMSNHTHVVLYVNESKADSWSTIEILSNWHRLFKGTLLTQQYINSEHLTQAERLTVEETANVYRARLKSISWFMRVLNESIARKANQEDECTGRFWEGRFKSQALLDEAALLSCMAYVDLNPIRAKLSKTPETSEHTSIKLRIQQALNRKQPKELMPFTGSINKSETTGLRFELADYIELVEVTGRYLREDKRGRIDHTLPDILERLKIEQEHWLAMSQKFEVIFRGAVGPVDRLSQFTEHQGKKRRSNLSICLEVFG